MPRSVTEIRIHMLIRRAGEVVFTGQTDISHMARSFGELVEWLGRDNSFPTGVFFLTGTGIVPENTFTLATGDIVQISIDGIGTLLNPVEQS